MVANNGLSRSCRQGNVAEMPVVYGIIQKQIHQAGLAVLA